LKFAHDPVEIARTEDIPEIEMPLEVDLVQGQALGLGKEPDQGGLADLAGSTKHQGLSVLRFEPEIKLD
jgi:hypothetical protein